MTQIILPLYEAILKANFVKIACIFMLEHHKYICLPLLHNPFCYLPFSDVRNAEWINKFNDSRGRAMLSGDVHPLNRPTV